MTDPPHQDDEPPSADPLGSVSVLLHDLRVGDRQAGLQLWSRYLPRLTALAAHTLAGRRPGISDPDDAVQSAWISFWKKLDAGAFPSELKRDDFWNLLGLIVVRKAQRQLRCENAAKRGGGLVFREADLKGDETPAALAAIAQPMTAADFDLQAEDLLQRLDEECREIALLRLTGHSSREIADRLGCTERKVQRKLELIRLRWSALLEES